VSDTPRTDAAVRDVDVAFVGHWGLSSEPQEFVSPEFTRELERENAALRSLVQHWYKLVPENICSSIEDAQKKAKPSA